VETRPRAAFQPPLHKIQISKNQESTYNCMMAVAWPSAHSKLFMIYDCWFMIYLFVY